MIIAYKLHFNDKTWVKTGESDKGLHVFFPKKNPEAP